MARDALQDSFWLLVAMQDADGGRLGRMLARFIKPTDAIYI